MSTSILPQTTRIPRGTMSPNLVRIHDLSAAFAGLEVAGLSRYPERALLMPGHAVISKGTPREYLDYLLSCGIGAGSVASVATEGDLTGRLSQDQLDQIKELVGNNFRLEFFLPTSAEANFVERHGFNYAQHVWGPTPALAELVNNKIWLRRQFGSAPDILARFPEHVILPVGERHRIIRQVLEYMISRNQGAILKHPTLASGDGLYRLHPGSWRAELEAAFADLAKRGYTGEVVIEAAHWDHVPLSAQLEIHNAGPLYLTGTTQQMINGTVHTGNRISSGQHPDICVNTVRQMEQESLQLAWKLWELGYRGYLGFDFILVGDRLLLIEANGRITGATYPLGVALQAQANGQTDWGVISDKLGTRNVSCDRLSQALRQQGLLFDGLTGVLPACPGLLVHGVAMLYSLGEDLAEADEHLTRARQLIATL